MVLTLEPVIEICTVYTTVAQVLGIASFFFRKTRFFFYSATLISFDQSNKDSQHPWIEDDCQITLEVIWSLRMRIESSCMSFSL